ncbi:MAG: sodium:proton antiporter [Lentisphaerae bacterium RIFOXYB12_FULL_65_16]|nr:MAG: sodium:proton antiporter [Lentisphaerae bacterium RIFOXYA12_64_32]OGV93186.1 MAG: sodium:proton antiporter [Lentisphaerae bacterium RIFOXYB12_FULL_65_16]
MSLIIVVFVLGYTAIAFEHPIKVNKSASALVTAGLLWTIYSTIGSHELVAEQLKEHLSGTAGIVFFLMAAMTIVEVIDAHDGFEVITSRIHTRSHRVLLWMIAFVTFFLSAILDNLTTTIVMISLTRRLLPRQQDRLFFAGVIVVAANAGGAWSPIGDVTTTMLWIGGQITSINIVKTLILPSLVTLLVPLAIISCFVKGEIAAPAETGGSEPRGKASLRERNVMFLLGIGTLVAVPVFKTITHLPPYIGILFGLGILWCVGELLHHEKTDEEKEPLTLVRALKHIDMSAIVFFLGILLAVAVLESTGQLATLAQWLDKALGSQSLIVMIIGLVSAVIDNVPLVAAAMGMYDLRVFPQDHFLWEFLAYCAGTGGSILIIGSAAGVAAMGLERITFFWYVRKISGLAFLGYIAGALTYIAQYKLLH